MEPFIGQVMAFGFPFAPEGWAQCNGQLLSVADYQALFSLIGTTYGGDGMTTFGVPDLRGRVPLHAGQGTALTPRPLGGVGGTETVLLTADQMPQHVHTVLPASGTAGATGTPGPGVTFAATSGPAIYAAAGAAATSALSPSVGPAGSNSTHDNMMPTLVANYCIALVGIYPSFD